MAIWSIGIDLISDGEIVKREFYSSSETPKFLKRFNISDEDIKKVSDITETNKKIKKLTEFDFVPTKETIEGSGKGKAELYDKAIPGFMKKYGKKWNAKVYDDSLDALPNPSMPVTILEITDEMRKSVQGTPQPLFEIFGGVGLSTWMANESKQVSDNMKNNIISNTTENMY